MLIKLKAAGIKVGDQRLKPTGLPLRWRCSDSGLGTYSHQGTIVGFWLGSSKGKRKKSTEPWTSLFLHLILQKSLPPSPHPTSFLPHTNSLRHLLLQFAGGKSNLSRVTQLLEMVPASEGLWPGNRDDFLRPSTACASSSFCVPQLWYFGVVFSKYFATLNWT